MDMLQLICMKIVCSKNTAPVAVSVFFFFLNLVNFCFRALSQSNKNFALDIAFRKKEEEEEDMTQ